MITDGLAIPGCPYAGGADEAYSCSYSGTASGHAVTVSGGAITAKITTAKLKVKCEDVFTSWTETLFDAGTITCTARQPNGNAVANVCGGVCTTPLPVQSLSYVGVDKLDMSVGDLSCDSSNLPSWITDIVVPQVEDYVIDAITPPIEDALNDVIGDYIPFPGMCQAPGS